MTKRFITSLLPVIALLLIVGSWQKLMAQDQPERFLTGVQNPEDLLQLPGTHWIIVSCYSSSTTKSGKLMAIDLDKQGTAPLEVFPGPTPLKNGNLPDNNPINKLFRPHGINCLQTGINQYRLFVISHGSEETIEIFDVDLRSEDLQITWSKSIGLPTTVWANGIVVSPDETVFVTSMYDPADKKFIDEFEKGKPTGQVWKWTSGQGWQTLNGKLLSGANGIEISRDGQILYVSEWATRRLWRFSLNRAIVDSYIQLDFLTDNLRWTEKGNLLLAGQKASPAILFKAHSLQQAVGGNQFSVAEINPVTFTANSLIDGGDRDFGWGTVAIAVGAEIWVGSSLTSRIACYKSFKTKSTR
ncbi:SMP-30/gluconolactonase/LRE family protein [Chitinophaga ginsengisegetis]|uniref:SMP-30/gluconolactonase/LRE family protein n=1 Tax=Chitinophaga ginsengisegetis TaxID=393003 RepID=UPI0034150DE8